MKQMIHLPRIARVVAAGVLSAAALSSAFAGQAADKAEAHKQETWREAIARTEVPEEGCFHASYPSLAWNKIECSVAPNIPYRPRNGRISQTVGEGNDYAAEVTTGLINETIGSFPTVTGVKTETGLLGANDYSLQLNSNFMNTAACNGASDPAECLDWEQFVYSSGYDEAFMQYWLINWNNPCPTGWVSASNDCYTNSAAVPVPQEAITKLETLTLSGSANNGGRDTLVFTVGTEAYSTTGSDSVIDLATAWKESEFNIFGDGDGSEATFNSVSSVTVKVAVSNGTEDAPTCASDAGTTAETNNLNLGSCAGTGGAAPYIEFIESNILLAALGQQSDYFGEGRADYTVWRPSIGSFLSIDGSGKTLTKAWGLRTDVPIIGDYDGDGKTDFAVFRPSIGTWLITYSSNGEVVTKAWGENGDIPVPGDYDGDGKTDYAVFRPSDGTWFIIYSSNGEVVTKAWGENGDIPVPGDYDGDGKTDYAVFRPSDGTWFIIYSSNGEVVTKAWGENGDIPVPGDYDGDGKTDYAVFRPSDGTWFIIYSSNGETVTKPWGTKGDVPAARDYDGDGKTDYAVFRPSDGTWFIIYSSNGEIVTQAWGISTDIPMNKPVGQ